MTGICLAHSQHMPSIRPAYAKHMLRMSGMCLAYAEHMPSACLGYAGHMLGICQAYAEHMPMPSICQAYARRMLGICRAYAKHMPGICRAGICRTSSPGRLCTSGPPPLSPPAGVGPGGILGGTLQCIFRTSFPYAIEQERKLTHAGTCYAGRRIHFCPCGNAPKPPRI